MITSAMYNGISGLQANIEAMSVIGNNISNVNTAGFKEGRALFSDLLSSNVTGNYQVGRGTQIQTVQNEFIQSSFDATQNATDLGIEGDGLFVLKNSSGQAYSRAGGFTLDNKNVLVNADGYQVMGYGVDQSTGKSNGTLGAIDLSSFETAQPNATTKISMTANLDSTQTTPTANSGNWDPTNPAGTSNFSASTTVYDSQGNASPLTLYFRKTGANAWEALTTSVIPPAAGTSITFNPDGSLATGSSFTVPSGTATVTVDITGTTQYANSSVVSQQNQDGYASGSLTKISVDTDGYVNGTYSNGQTQKVAQVALARFASLDGLSKIGGTLFEETSKSGQAQISTADSMGGNQIKSNSLEQSNVDLAVELVNMITTQRAYSANSKTITVSDQMMQDTLNLLR